MKLSNCDIGELWNAIEFKYAGRKKPWRLRLEHWLLRRDIVADLGREVQR